MLIIIEGPDGVGKTTLAESLAKELAESGDEVELLHRGPPKSHPLDEYVLPLLDYVPGLGRHVICDRWHWGEAVYPQVLDRTSLLDDPVFRYIEMFLRSRGALVVRPYASLELLTSRLLVRGDNLIGVDQLEEIRRGYLRVSSWSRLPQYFRDVADHGLLFGW